jgi:hypothetical protein
VHIRPVDRLLTAGNGAGWAICGAGVTPADQQMQNVLRDQQGMYTLVLRYSDGREEARIIGSIVDFLYAPDDPERLLEKLTAPESRIVSLTITEGGYNLHAVTGEFDAAMRSYHPISLLCSPTRQMRLAWCCTWWSVLVLVSWPARVRGHAGRPKRHPNSWPWLKPEAALTINGCARCWMCCPPQC